MEPDRNELLAVQNRWSAPAELSIPPPRPVRLTSEGKVLFRLAGLLAAGALVATIYALSLAVKDVQRLRLLKSQGVTTEALVVDKSTSGRRSFVEYRFEAGGRSYTRNAYLWSSRWGPLRSGDRVAVRYAAGDPRVSRLALETSRDVGGIEAVPVLFLASLAWLVSRQARSARALLREGQASGALVARVSTWKGREHVSYEFLDLAGIRQRGESAVPLGSAPKPGDAATILFDPSHPRRNTLYPSSFASIAPPHRG